MGFNKSCKKISTTAAVLFYITVMIKLEVILQGKMID